MDKITLKNPNEVYNALKNDKTIKSWLKFISEKYVPPKSKVCIFYPCTSIKPFSKSQSYRQLFKTLDKIPSHLNFIHIYTVSEPFGIIPFEIFDQVPDYDCPGLFEWWCKRNGEIFDRKYQDKSVRILADYSSKFLKKIHNCQKIALVRSYSSSLEKRNDHTHRRILELASKLSGERIDIIPNKRTVKKVVEIRGRYAWDRYGPSHPIVQDMLLKKINKILNDIEI
jgi:archaeosine synthase